MRYFLFIVLVLAGSCMNAQNAGIARIDSLNRLSTRYIDEANYREAVLNAMIALQFSDSLKYTPGMAGSYYNLGVIVFYQEDKAKSIDYASKALRLFKETKDQKGIADSYNLLGRNYINEPGNSKSLNYFFQASDLYKLIGDKKGIATCLHNLAVIYINKNDYKNAYEYLSKALEIYSGLNDDRLVSSTLVNLAFVCRRQNHLPEAFRHLRRAEEYALRSGSKEHLKLVYASLFDYYESRHDFEKALKYYKLYEELSTALLNEKTSREIYNLQQRHETEKKEKEIQVLKQQNQIKNLEIKKEKITIYFIVSAFIFTLFLALILYNRYKIKKNANELLTIQKNLVEGKNKDILDSIRYAKRIQEAILPSDKKVKRSLPDSFVIYKPKDIVSGDFYWVEEKSGKVLFAAVDCTGHGVSGAFMSIVGYNLLNEYVNKQGITAPSEILDKLNRGVMETLRKNEDYPGIRDGMDIALCSLDAGKRELEYAGVFNPLWIIRQQELIEIKADKLAIGSVESEAGRYSNHSFRLEKDDCIYIFSDGYADQFGGPDGKKFKNRQLKELLLSMHNEPMESQKGRLEEAFRQWKSDLEQVDDILILGVKV